MKRKNVYADVIIAVVIGITSFVTISVITEYRRLNVPIPADVLGVLMAFWGGELLTVALRQIFGADVFKSIRKGGKEDEKN